ncbi:hypothetical protein H7H48_17115 [Nitratireductor sp. B36]|uniref:hypothetical protein n=1 Tax=Nitratireductor sp. B36 TaxID=2762059 RepID=UPI001E4C568A|nr:hypothetical protein [Nitratireductor sp. B36]MCC5780786.1 hypothetical protein [Nitratireductor sp. B36]
MTRSINLHSENERLQLMLACCFRASQQHFSHLAIRDIVAPPREKLDAALARQVALTLMRDAFDVPQRRTSKLVDRNRGRIAFAMWTVTKRRQCPVFNHAYQRMSDRALHIYHREIMKLKDAA